MKAAARKKAVGERTEAWLTRIAELLADLYGKFDEALPGLCQAAQKEAATQHCDVWFVVRALFDPENCAHQDLPALVLAAAGKAGLSIQRPRLPMSDGTTLVNLAACAGTPCDVDVKMHGVRRPEDLFGIVQTVYRVTLVGFVPMGVAGIVEVQAGDAILNNEVLTFHPVTLTEDGTFGIKYLKDPPLCSSGCRFNTAEFLSPYNWDVLYPDGIVGFAVNVRSSKVTAVTFAPDAACFISGRV